MEVQDVDMRGPDDIDMHVAEAAEMALDPQAAEEDEEAAGSDEPGEPTADDDEDEDSSEEEEENEEEMRKVAKDFIVDEIEEEESEEDLRETKRRRKKRRHRHREEEEDLDDDDRELMEENMGYRPGRKLTRVRRGRIGSDDGSASPEPAPSRQATRVDDLQNIWEEEQRDDDMEEADYMDDFIVDEGEEGELDEEERKERRRAERERRRAMGARPDMDGIDAAAWDEIFEVFGDGRDYDWALEGEEANEETEEAVKPDMKYTDVFEPSEIKARHLTEDDDIIRMTDIPERMQLSSSSLSPSATLTLHDDFDFSQHLSAAAAWVAMRISPRITRDFFRQGAPHQALLTPLIIAISRILEFMLIRNFEVPYIYTHHHDLISHFDYEKRVMTELLSRDELWRVGILGMKFRALTERKEILYKTYEKMGVNDDYFDSDLKDHLDSIEAVADASEWLGMKYRQALKDAVEMPEDDSVDVSKRIKKPTRTSPYETAKSTIASKLAEGFGISSAEIVRNFISKAKKSSTTDQDVTPVAYANEFVTDGPAGVIRDAEKQLELARLIIATEIGKDPVLRQRIRTLFEGSAVISCLPTERGNEKIDEFHPYMNFKFLKEKPIEKMKDSPQFLHILQAEHDHLITVQIKLHDQAQHVLERDLSNAFFSDGTGPVSKGWNAERKLVVTEALEKHLLPLGIKWAREWLREEIEDSLAKKCGDSLQDRINRAPYRTEDIEPGDVPSVMAVSWGKGDPQKDAVHIVVLDEEGRLRDHLKLDNLLDEELKEQFTELIKRRNPDVIVVGGFTASTKKLMDQVKLLVNGPPDPAETKAAPNGQPSSKQQASSSEPNGNWGAAASDGWGATGSQSNDPWGAPASQSSNADPWGATPGGDWGSAAASGDWANPSAEQTPAANPASSSSPERPKSKEKSKEKEERKTPIIYVNDEVARIYQHSKRAEDEYGRIPLLGRYCVGLARYVQSPLNEYASLGSDLAAMSFDECQTLVPKDKLFVAFERALVNVVNTVGVDINRAVIDSYYQTLLPFVAGLGPRKAEQLLQRISTLGGTLVNRSQLIHENVLGMTVFLNCSGFLRISRDMSYRKSSSKKRKNKDSTDAVPDPLDDTRIHPEDYDLAKQMALDALEIDQDDVEDDAHAAQLIGKLMEDPDNAKKLNVLNLDDFAATLFKTQGKEKRHTLDMIKQELLRPFGERRKEFLLPDKWDILTMLTGETESTLQRGKIVSVSVARVKSNFVAVRMDSGLDGVLAAKYLSNDGHAIPEQVVQKGQTIPAVIIAVYVDEFRVEFSARPMDIQTGDAHTRRIPLDECYDKVLMERNKDIADRKKRREVDQIRRIIKHPNFHNLNYKQAEELLSHQQRGDVVIRPSTKGPDHLAVTWKVDDGLYQHIDVVEPNADITSQTVGSHLVVDGKYQFSDLDELIVNHVKAMARKVEELMAHDKFNGKPTDSEIHVDLDQKIRSMRTIRSVYAFGLNRSRPGCFNLHFKANTMSPIQTLLVKVNPNGYLLDGQEFESVAKLCDGFKTKVGRMGGAPGAQTPYGSARTPAMTPGRGGGGGATPGHMSSRQTPGYASSRVNPSVGKTPNPYAASAAKTPNPYAPPAPGAGGGRPPVPAAASGGGWGAPPAAPGGSWGATGGNWGQSPAPQRGGPPPPQPPPGGGAPAGMHPSRAAMLNAANSRGNDWGSNRY
ncbi:hypothetical protein M407DRAFT_30136 [Tulasnella calospora MUT 4182]|uniref:Transcription elongation factor Spt6 n=1 Tax=Tulasnella calospora MUT 4182 TaxID=1051891 RepID=A0A0C3LFK0_9AGAM|nr:hypothetical protein M407DRAFT_30136 [Tulasnella calospora MUT 4182]